MRTLTDIIKKIHALFLSLVTRFFGIGKAKCLDSYLRFGRKINLDEPETLADKVTYLYLFALPELAVKCTDKWEAREYVRSKGLGDILVPIFGDAVDDAMALRLDMFPERFVLKATHGCGMNYICTDKAHLNENELRKTAKRWLRTTYGTYSVEPHYSKLRARVYCEKLLAESSEIIDYKFFCCNGIPTTLLVCSERQNTESSRSKVKMKLYNMDWEPVNGLKNSGKHSEVECDFLKPENFDEMIGIAEHLSEDFDFVRVDLYNLNGKIYFGELTFSPASGAFESYTDSFIKQEGKKLKITGKDID